MDTTLVNLTPDIVRIHDACGDVLLELPTCAGTVARVDETSTLGDVLVVAGKVVVRTSMMCSSVENLPDPQPNVVYITSSQVAQFVRRPDVMSLASGPGHEQYDKDGRLFSVSSLVRWV